MTANTCGVARCIVSVIVCQVCEAITSYLGPKTIALKRLRKRSWDLVVKFESRHVFP